MPIFRRVLHARPWILMGFCILVAAGIYGLTQTATDSAIERLVVAGDPVAQTTRDFERVFPEGEQAILMLESPDPFSADALQGAGRLERDLNKIPQVSAHSVMTLFRHGGPPVDIGPDDAARLRAFAT